MRRFSCTLLAGLLLTLGGFRTAAGEETPSTPEAERHFELHVRPLLVGTCLKCHGEAKQEGGLRLDSLAAMLKGGDSGPAIVPGDADASLLLEAVRYESLEMPPSGQMEQDQIAHLTRWIAAGAAWPRDSAILRPAARGITTTDRTWWAFRPLHPGPVPKGDERWSRNAIDRFVSHRLQSEGMEPAPQADRERLVRRLYFDVLGVPPTVAEIDAFLADNSPAAWPNLVDRLLEDPRYGEHWARFWLDLVRYADSDGWNQDAYRPHLFRYRDYVVSSFNQDRPWSQFVRQQLAGDEIPDRDADDLAATGFLRLGIYEYNQRDAKSHWDDIMNETTDVAGDVFLGLGMACARCHDHKFDPILQADYFKLRAFFEPLIWRDDVPAATRQQVAEYERNLAAWQQATADVQARIDELLKPYHDRKWQSTVAKFPLDIQACFQKPVAERTSWEHQMAYLVSRQFEEEGGGPLKSMKDEDKKKYEELKKELAGFDKLKPKPLPALMTVSDFSGSITPTIIPDTPGPVQVEPGFLVVMTPPAADSTAVVEGNEDSSGRRAALADWIVDPDNPLTWRVIVNRIWQQHFGQGLVPSLNDFGRMGQRPSHPELLDWLALQFIQEGGRMKALHRLILNSATWRQAVDHPQALAYQQRDPQERLLWRARTRRLSAEQIRDAMLQVSGELKTQLGGASVSSSVPRRSLYVKRFRNTPEELLHAFDTANGLKPVAVRNVTTTPTQALLLINGEYVLGRANEFAKRILADESAGGLDRATLAYRTAWGRSPTDFELQAAASFLELETNAAPEARRWTDFCHVLLNSNEFLYVD